MGDGGWSPERRVTGPLLVDEAVPYPGLFPQMRLKVPDVTGNWEIPSKQCSARLTPAPLATFE